MSVTLTREQRRSLRRMEERLTALQAGIRRHEERIVELKGVRERLQGERASLLAEEAPAPPAEPVETPVETEPPEAATEPAPQGRAERRTVPPPEAERVGGAGVTPDGETEALAIVTPADVVDRFRSYQRVQRHRRTPQVVYPLASSEGEPVTGSVLSETVLLTD